MPRFLGVPVPPPSAALAADLCGWFAVTCGLELGRAACNAALTWPEPSGACG
ncbi:hypothetical protein ODS41_07755 [Pyrobaculum sp. 3827-6]|uniref:hypothetical protein n=1 Tax=Pyrobaculum sp. 3827-6 TaxID=2983604 RepID=UPI0021D9FE8A|nr:hypothetical protein [Pyrobaculum sp. 3827-6]MCU7787806.1 hypothetical protein [Pyrobaculum sp. 3827-6]